MDTNEYDGFINLRKKQIEISPILSKYEFESATIAAFAITSWRNNRGAQESCLAINAAISGIRVWGKQKISSFADFKNLYEELFPILGICSFDDPVLRDFGEVKLCFHLQYYSIITGTGHTVPVFAVLQFLEYFSDLTQMTDSTQELLDYCNDMISFLRESNAPADQEYSTLPEFECPSAKYFIR